MKIFLLSLLLALSLISSSFSQIPNGSFENWTSGNPDGWGTTNITGLINVTQSTTAHTGSYAARGDVYDFFTYPMPPIIFLGSEDYGYPISSSPVAITGYYQFSPQGGDRFGVDAVLYSNGEPVAVGAILSGDAASSYTQFTAVFNYLSAETPDTLKLLIMIVGPTTGSDPHIGSWMLVDDIALSGTTGVDDLSSNFKFHLEQNYPNPFNPSTKINYSVAQQSNVSIRVYDALGVEVASLIDEEKPAGNYSVQLNASDLSSGVYFYTIRAGSFVETKKMMFLK